MKKYKFSVFICLLFICGWFFAAVASAATTNTTINASIGPVISLLTSDGTLTVNLLPSEGGVQSIAEDTVTVSTNDSNGYTLTINDSSGSTSALKSGGNSIPASAGTQTSPVAESVNTWGYCVENVGGFGTNCPSSTSSNQSISGSEVFAGVPLSSSPNTIAVTNSTANNVTTSVWYGVTADDTLPYGTYSSTIVYTATTN